MYSADVTDADSLIAAANQCIATQALPDVVVANAGISVGIDSAVRADLNVMVRIFATNNLGMAATFYPFIEPMRARGSGTLVGIASVAGIRGLLGHGAYCASKAAVISYCESVRGSGVRVVIISPGYIDTPLTRQNQYLMPFLMPPEKFAEKAFATIQAGVGYRVIPWQMALVAKIMRLLPSAVFDWLASGRPRKQRTP